MIQVPSPGQPAPRTLTQPQAIILGAILVLSVGTGFLAYFYGGGTGRARTLLEGFTGTWPTSSNDSTWLAVGISLIILGTLGVPTVLGIALDSMIKRSEKRVEQHVTGLLLTQRDRFTKAWIAPTLETELKGLAVNTIADITNEQYDSIAQRIVDQASEEWDRATQT